MLKKLITYQRVLLNSMPPLNMTSPNPLTTTTYIVAIFVMIFMNFFIFMGTRLSANTTLAIVLPAVSVWMINRILYGDHKLFDTLPVSKKYTLLNIYLLSIVISTIGYLTVCISFIAFIWLLVGLLTIFSPQNMTTPAQDVALNIIDITKGNNLILCLLVILIFGGVAITFIKRKKLRLLSFLGFATITYAFLFLLKINLPISPTTGQVEFLESFSIMPSGNIILICVFIATIIIIITSIFMGFKLYVGKLPSRNHDN
ncbi:MAG: hypothetical protein ACREVX_07070 [Clostridium sp.]|uniref:hypothetical protein n=1 Tax=Clostridium sp. TaxID=1506 RepID=UPI003D6CFCF7